MHYRPLVCNDNNLTTTDMLPRRKAPAAFIPTLEKKTKRSNTVNIDNQTYRVPSIKFLAVHRGPLLDNTQLDNWTASESPYEHDILHHDVVCRTPQKRAESTAEGHQGITQDQ